MTEGGAMDTEDQIRMLKSARRELDEARVRVAHLEQVVDGLTGLLAASGVDVGVNPAGENALPGMGMTREMMQIMRPRDAVLFAMGRRPGYRWNARRVYEFLEEHGLINPEVKSGAAAYDMALRRLAEESGSGVERDDETGTYVFRLTSASAAERNRLAHGVAAEMSELGSADLEARNARVRQIRERDAALTAAKQRERLSSRGRAELEARNASQKLTAAEMHEIEAARRARKLNAESAAKAAASEEARRKAAVNDLVTKHGQSRSGDLG